MIALISIALATYEAFAIKTRRPTVTDLSHTLPLGLLVWSWWVLLGRHFLEEVLND